MPHSSGQTKMHIFNSPYARTLPDESASLEIHGPRAVVRKYTIHRTRRAERNATVSLSWARFSSPHRFSPISSPYLWAMVRPASTLAAGNVFLRKHLASLRKALSHEPKAFETLLKH